MAKLHYQRWVEKFSIDTFSSEDSMRDYLFSNPALIFEEDTWVIPIEEEKCLPESSFDNKNYGRADIILCRIFKDKEEVKRKEELSLEEIELWIVELKKNEVSYENGFKQLFDYMAVVKEDEKIREKIIGEVINKVKERLGLSRLKLKDSDKYLSVFGSLVAPSFGFIERTTESIGVGVTKYKVYIDLNKVLIDKGKIEEGFTLIDVVDAAGKLDSPYYISLVKLIRFKRGDETIIYSENVLGRRATAQVARVDPVELFQNNAIKEDENFYFRDDKGTVHKELEFRVLNKRGPSHSFMIKIKSIKGHNSILIPKWAKDHYEFKHQELPIECTVKTCSIALHNLYEIYKEDELFKYHWSFGEKNFIREREDKSLSELREEQRLR